MNKLYFTIDLSDAEQNRKLRNRFAACRDTVKITIEKWKPKRSNSFNRFYFGVVVAEFVEFNREQGVIYSHETAHSIIKMAVLPPVEFADPKTGEVRRVPADTHEMNTEEFSDFVLLAMAWCGEFGIEFPDPPQRKAVPIRRTAAVIGAGSTVRGNR